MARCNADTSGPRKLNTSPASLDEKETLKKPLCTSKLKKIDLHFSARPRSHRTEPQGRHDQGCARRHLQAVQEEGMLPSCPLCLCHRHSPIASCRLIRSTRTLFLIFSSAVVMTG